MSNFNSQKFNITKYKSDFSLIVKFFGYIFIIFSLLPWVSFNLNDYDSQPWSFIFAVLFLLIISKKIILPLNSIKIFITIFIGIIITILTHMN